MKKVVLSLTLLLTLISISMADLQMPPEPTIYDKLGRGFANIVVSPVHLLDSTYSVMQEEGLTAGGSKGIVQGISRCLMDVGTGLFDVTTFFWPTETIKFPAYDTRQIEAYPPADLLDNWY